MQLSDSWVAQGVDLVVTLDPHKDFEVGAWDQMSGISARVDAGNGETLHTFDFPRMEILTIQTDTIESGMYLLVMVPLGVEAKMFVSESIMIGPAHMDELLAASEALLDKRIEASRQSGDTRKRMLQEVLDGYLKRGQSELALSVQEEIATLG